MGLISVVREGMNRYRARKLTKCGKHVWISRTAHLQGNIEVGDDVRIGDRANFVSTMATLRIGSHVVFGPDVTIYTGDHATDFLGYHISEITDDMKRARGKAYDRDVVIEAGCWIGTRAMILKGVTVGRGSVIGAGAIVTRDVPPYSVYVGVPDVRVYPRFTEEQIAEHERILASRKML